MKLQQKNIQIKKTFSYKIINFAMSVKQFFAS